MGFQIQNIGEKDRFLVVDIGTARIKLLLCEVGDEWLIIVDTLSVRQSRKHMLQGEILDLQGVSDSIMKAIEKIENEQEETKRIIYSISSPYLITDTLSMNYVRTNESEPLTMEEIDTMVAKVEQKSLEKIRPKILVQISLEDTQMKLITTTITSITIDGKKVSNPVGFTGKNMSLTVCNVFIPQATFLLYSAVARKIDREIISFVPAPIVLPKSQIDSMELFDPNCYIDIGNSLTTIVLENFSEILWAVQIPLGTSTLENMMVRKFPKLSRLEIEHKIHTGDIESNEDSWLRIEFAKILAESVAVALKGISSSYVLRNLYLSGGIVSDSFVSVFQSVLPDYFSHSLLKAQKLLPEDTKLSGEFGISYSLARTTQELVRQNKDPIAKILRYVLYRYE